MTITIEPIQIIQEVQPEQLINPAQILANLQPVQVGEIREPEYNEDIADYVVNSFEQGDMNDIIQFEEIYEDISELFRMFDIPAITRESLHYHLQEMDVIYCMGLYVGQNVRGTNVYIGLKWR